MLTIQASTISMLVLVLRASGTINRLVVHLQRCRLYIGLYRDNGKENGNYYVGFRVYGYIGVQYAAKRGIASCFSLCFYVEVSSSNSDFMILPVCSRQKLCFGNLILYVDSHLPYYDPTPFDYEAANNFLVRIAGLLAAVDSDWGGFRV